MAEQIARCSYCILGDDFSPMLPRQEGWFFCLECGHTVMPDDPNFKCSCRKCTEMNRAA
jgi:hypothetical protein